VANYVKYVKLRCYVTFGITIVTIYQTYIWQTEAEDLLLCAQPKVQNATKDTRE